MKAGSKLLGVGVRSDLIDIREHVADHFDYVAGASKHEVACFRSRCYKNKKICTC